MRIAALTLCVLAIACGESSESSSTIPADMVHGNDMSSTADVMSPDMMVVDGALPDLMVADGTLPDMMAVDTAVPDMMLVDAAVPDMAVVDAALPDMMVADGTLPDMMVVDGALPDMMLVDAAVPDMAVDTAVRDMMVVDTAVPDMMVVDTMPQPACDDGVENGEETGIDCGGVCMACPPVFEIVYPAPYERALRNPLKGFTTNGVNPHEWATLSHVYIRWNELEDDESHGMDRIRQVTEQKFGDVAARNVKVIPRVYLHWSRDDQKYWPADMQTDDYSSEHFRNRLTRLVGRLGQVWNEDPRVAFVELGIFGKWGEHHSPDPTPDMQTIAAQSFADAFPDKHVSVRHAWHQFTGHGFGEYWDSFAHYDQMYPHGERVREMNATSQRYLTNYIGGEAAYNWGNWARQPGVDPSASVRDPVHRDFVINAIKWLHCTQLRWIHAYDDQDPETQAGAELVHKIMGYRFVVDEASFTPHIHNGDLQIQFTVRNQGAAPFYYDWPLMVALLDPVTKSPVWTDTFTHVDIRNWVGGAGYPGPDWLAVNHWSQFVVPDNWSDEPLVWAIPEPTHSVRGQFAPQVPQGQYILAIAIADPANGQPNLRLATNWYLNGGWHPLGLVSTDGTAAGPLPADFNFDDPHTDQTLNYQP